MCRELPGRTWCSFSQRTTRQQQPVWSMSAMSPSSDQNRWRRSAGTVARHLSRTPPARLAQLPGCLAACCAFVAVLCFPGCPASSLQCATRNIAVPTAVLLSANTQQNRNAAWSVELLISESLPSNCRPPNPPRERNISSS